MALSSNLTLYKQIFVAEETAASRAAAPGRVWKLLSIKHAGTVGLVEKSDGSLLLKLCVFGVSRYLGEG